MILYFDDSDFREGVTYIFMDSDQLFVETVAFQVCVGHHTANTVFGETRGVDAKSPQQLQNGGIDIAVALQLDDDQVSDVGVTGVLVVVERDAEVDGESLGESAVDQRDTFKAVLDMGLQVGQLEPRLFGNEGTRLLGQRLEAGIGLDGATRHLDTLLLGAAVIVLVLDLQEGIVRILIFADTYLLTHLSARLMEVVHPMVGGVQIDGVIRSRPLSVRALHIVVGRRDSKQRSQLGNGNDILGVDTVHQLDALHLFQPDGLEPLKFILDDVVTIAFLYLIRHAKIY